ncbi:gp164 [Bacillus phage W.Ph.]|uniref:Gp164 n=1 Tax=Bacillus phage W.Ph. TaxID=764595 RepID=G9B1R5_9CAUD|nr:gp164 [Bacillus phage W.Ph.]ADH03310.1 gp164 [Bacillus phage W.Ph.]
MKQQQLERQVEALENKVAHYEMVLKNIARREKSIMSEQAIRRFSGWAVLTRSRYVEATQIARDVLHKFGVKVRKGDNI